MDEKKIKKICNLINKEVSDPFEKLLAISKEISKDEENYGIVLQVLIEEYGEQYSQMLIEREESSDVVSKDMIMYLKRKYYDLLIALIDRLVDENQEEVVFYDRLYEIVFHSELFHLDEIEKTIILYFLIARINVLPYYKIETKERISKEDFTQIVDELSPLLKKVVHVINRNYFSRAQEAEALCNILDEVTDTRSRAVLLSAMFQIKEQREED